MLSAAWPRCGKMSDGINISRSTSTLIMVNSLSVTLQLVFSLLLPLADPFLSVIDLYFLSRTSLPFKKSP